MYAGYYVSTVSAVRNISQTCGTSEAYLISVRVAAILTCSFMYQVYNNSSSSIINNIYSCIIKSYVCFVHLYIFAWCVCVEYIFVNYSRASVLRWPLLRGGKGL